jgi:hypothetical protein
MEKKLVNEFCLESIIPGIKEALVKESLLEVLDVVLKRANRDVMTGARSPYFSDTYRNNQEDYIKCTRELIEKQLANLSSKNLIKAIIEKSKEEPEIIAEIQKLVNMALKYLYVIQEYGYNEKLGYTIVLSKCDCPLDSTILDELHRRTKKTYPTWTQLKSLKDYDEIQTDIETISKKENKTKLEFDFENWKKH